MAKLPSLVVHVVSVLLLGILRTTIANVRAEEVCHTKQQCDEPDFIGNFHIPTQPVPRLQLNNPLAHARLKKGLPVVLTDTGIFTTEQPWSIKHLHHAYAESPAMWKVSNSDDRRFMYFNSNINYANYKFTPPYNNTFMKFSEFVDLHRKTEENGQNKRLYLKSTLYVGPDYKTKYDFNRTADDYIRRLRGALEPSTEPVVYIGMKDVLTPMHFDYNENMIVQVYGRKRCILVSPEHYPNLYPYPKSHPHDRQSMVDMENPDYDRFPRFRQVSGYEAILQPGDALTLPSFWWHLVESEHHSETVSLSFSDIPAGDEFREFAVRETAAVAKTRPDGTVVYNTREQQAQLHKNAKDFFEKSKVKEPIYFPRPDRLTRQIHIRRTIEQLIAESSGNYRNVGPILRELYEGRFDDLEFNEH